MYTSFVHAHDVPAQVAQAAPWRWRKAPDSGAAVLARALHLVDAMKRTTTRRPLKVQSLPSHKLPPADGGGYAYVRYGYLGCACGFTTWDPYEASWHSCSAYA